MHVDAFNDVAGSILTCCRLQACKAFISCSFLFPVSNFPIRLANAYPSRFLLPLLIIGQPTNGKDLRMQSSHRMTPSTYDAVCSPPCKRNRREERSWIVAILSLLAPKSTSSPRFRLPTLFSPLDAGIDMSHENSTQTGAGILDIIATQSV